jgi:hypothetical protein
MMRRKIFTQSLTATLIICLWAVCAPATLAHDGPPRLELSAERLNPGAALEVRGINIAPELPIALALVGGGAEYSLGQVLGDPHGDFTLAVEVPREATSGDYTVRAFGTNRVVVAARLAVAGAPAALEGEGGQRDESEPLLAPMPRAGGEPEIQPAHPAAPRVEPPAAPPVITIPLWLAVAIGVSLAAIGLAVVLRRRAAGASEVVH